MINIPSKSDKERSVILDAFRILAWQQYKQDTGVSGLEGYETFSQEWNAHEVHDKTFTELKDMASELGYSLADLKKIRTDYYQSKNNGISDDSDSTNSISNGASQSYTENENLDDIPF
ncbi:hypothetical protein PN462_21080 [Spirulina sp. CS-785/01]|uniref:hypothetical protein n=1 Tax=Spirulina sp. CS-785/01 TaxID=3021716 RepID=UPI00232A87BD|nr:hypothetical protein [Spirulina sp. CS-785/01]MDB9315620.1 hypothetical protein [Spirulina sp. CS-785/01]